MVTNIKSQRLQTIMKISITISAILFVFFVVNAQQNISNNPPCNPVSNLSVTYTPDCKAILTWDAPAKGRSEILWDNTNIDITDEIISSYWSLSNTWVFTADDFEADSKWRITKIYSKGNSNAPSELPTKFSITIYLDQAGKPGTEIYRNTEIFVTDGANPEFILPESFELPDAGKYWLAIAGAYDVAVYNAADVANYRWDVYCGTPPIGFNFHLHDHTEIFPGGWLDASMLVPNAYSMYFKIEGERSTEKTTYNIYRDGVLLTTIEETSYTDADFDPFTDHIWEVTVVCADSESEAMSETLEACGLRIITTTLPDGIIGELYNQTLTADGNAPITWTLETGNLPAGLELSSDGTISGNPTTEEISNFMVKAQNSTSFDTQDLSITIQTLGIAEISKIAIYPNPANNLIYMGDETAVNVRVYNSMGQLVNSYEKVNVIDVSSYKSGIYFFKIATIEGNIKNFKVIVTN